MSRGLGIIRKMGHKLQSRHWRGHGIHSPYFYQLITEVIENKNKPDCKQQLKIYHRKNKLSISHKRLLLFLRFIDSFESNQILLLGAHAPSIIPYIHTARKHAAVQVLPHLPSPIEITAPDFIYLSEPLTTDWINCILEHSSVNTCIMLNSIHSFKQVAFWKHLSSQWKHSIDLFDTGLLFNKDEVPPLSIKY